MGLETVNHNLSNANTPGYSRQRVDQRAHEPYSYPVLLGPSLATGQLGQGTEVAQITRARDAFLDGQYRLETSTLHKHKLLAETQGVMEGILGEPSDTGIAAALQNFFDAAQQLSINPDSIPVRTVYVQAAKEVVETFQEKAEQLAAERQNLVGDANVPSSVATSQLSVYVGDINEKAQAIADLNRQIVTITAAGGRPNDLLDRRDLLLDEFATLADITVTQSNNNLINVSVGGITLVQGATVLDTLEVVANANTPPYDASNPDPADVPALVRSVNTSTVINDDITGGKVAGLLDIGGHPAGETSYRSLILDLNTLLTSLVDRVNDLQTDTVTGTGANAGRDLDGNQATENIFTLSAGSSLEIFRYEVNPNIVANTRLVAAAIEDGTASGPPAGWAGVGDGRNALAMAQVKTQVLAGLGSISPSDYFSQIVSGLGVDSRSNSDRTDNQQALADQLDQRRTSVSGVNQDEELIDLVRYQRAFEASARMVRVFDEALQTLINMAA
jgi:flagellar hook-associated protein 1 FlgK